MSKSTSPLAYQRHKELRTKRKLPLSDRHATALPRYGMKTVLSHRRGEKGMEKWLEHV